jgi:hypothetical protein
MLVVVRSASSVSLPMFCALPSHSTLYIILQDTIDQIPILMDDQRTHGLLVGWVMRWAVCNFRIKNPFFIIILCPSEFDQFYHSVIVREKSATSAFNLGALQNLFREYSRELRKPKKGGMGYSGRLTRNWMSQSPESYQQCHSGQMRHKPLLQHDAVRIFEWFHPREFENCLNDTYSNDYALTKKLRLPWWRAKEFDR